MLLHMLQIFIQKKTKQISKCRNFGGGDTVTVYSNCDEAILRLYVSNEQVTDDIKINNTKTYHAMMTVWTKTNVSFELIEPTLILDLI